MKKYPNISTDDGLNNYKELLNSFKESHDPDLISEIIGYIKGIEECESRKLRIDFNNKYDIILKRIQEIIDGCEDHFTKEEKRLNYIFNETNSLMYHKKMFQLSRINGYIENDDRYINIDNDIKNYMKYQLFVDYFESFPKLIIPLLKLHWEELSGHYWLPWYKTNDYYNIICAIIPSFLKTFHKDKKMLFNLRNDFAHSNIYINEVTIEFFEPVKMKFSKNRIPLDEILEISSGFNRLSTIISTKLDYSIMKIGTNKSMINNVQWLGYFEAYKGEIDRIGN